jgi:hypothetical protein
MAHFEVSQGYRSELKEIDGKLETVIITLNYFSVNGVKFQYVSNWPKTIDKALQRAKEYAATMNRLFPPAYWEAMQKVKYNGSIDKPYIEPENRKGKLKSEFKKQSKELAKLVNCS